MRHPTVRRTGFSPVFLFPYNIGLPFRFLKQKQPALFCAVFHLQYLCRTNKKCRMKIAKYWMMLLSLVLLCNSCSCNKTEKDAAEAADTLPPDETISKGVVQLERSHVTDTASWNGRLYRYDIVREPDNSLPKIKDEESGGTFSDNHIDLTITCEGRQILKKRFFKTTFNKFLDADFRQKGILEGLVFDIAIPEGLRFATSISYPRSDLYIPLVITVGADGQITIRKDEVLDSSEEEI